MNPTSRFRKFSVCPYCKNEKDCSEENTKSVDEQLFDKETMDVIHGLNQPFQQKPGIEGELYQKSYQSEVKKREQVAGDEERLTDISDSKGPDCRVIWLQCVCPILQGRGRMTPKEVLSCPCHHRPRGKAVCSCFRKRGCCPEPQCLGSHGAKASHRAIGVMLLPPVSLEHGTWIQTGLFYSLRSDEICFF